MRTCLVEDSTVTLACPVLLKIAVRSVVGLCGSCLALWGEGRDAERDVVKSIIEEIDIFPRETGVLGPNPLLVG